MNRCLEKPAGRCNFAQNALAMTDDLEPFAFCICCGKPLSAAGRLDRKFCDERCKNRYHNRIRYPKRESRQQEILHILDRNRSILARLVTLGIHSLDRRALQHLGYDTDYITSYTYVPVSIISTSSRPRASSGLAACTAKFLLQNELPDEADAPVVGGEQLVSAQEGVHLFHQHIPLEV